MVTNVEMEITDIFISHKVDKENCIGLMCMLREIKAQDQMLSWLKANPNIDAIAIGEHVDELYEQYA